MCSQVDRPSPTGQVPTSDHSLLPWTCDHATSHSPHGATSGRFATSFQKSAGWKGQNSPRVHLGNAAVLQQSCVTSPCAARCSRTKIQHSAACSYLPGWVQRKLYLCKAVAWAHNTRLVTDAVDKPAPLGELQWLHPSLAGVFTRVGQGKDAAGEKLVCFWCSKLKEGGQRVAPKDHGTWNGTRWRKMPKPAVPYFHSSYIILSNVSNLWDCIDTASEIPLRWRPSVVFDCHFECTFVHDVMGLIMLFHTRHPANSQFQQLWSKENSQESLSDFPFLSSLLHLFSFA